MEYILHSLIQASQLLMWQLAIRSRASSLNLRVPS